MELNEDPFEEGRIAAAEQERARHMDITRIENVAFASSRPEQNVAMPPIPSVEDVDGTEHQTQHDRLLLAYREDEPNARFLLDDLQTVMRERVHLEMGDTMRRSVFSGTIREMFRLRKARGDVANPLLATTDFNEASN